MPSPAEHVAGMKRDAEELLESLWEENVRKSARPSEAQAFLVSFAFGAIWFAFDLDGKVRGDPQAAIEFLRKQHPAQFPNLAPLLALSRVAVRVKAMDTQA